jgi:hypothetical protein
MMAGLEALVPGSRAKNWLIELLVKPNWDSPDEGFGGSSNGLLGPVRRLVQAPFIDTPQYWGMQENWSTSSHPNLLSVDANPA